MKIPVISFHVLHVPSVRNLFLPQMQISLKIITVEKKRTTQIDILAKVCGHLTTLSMCEPSPNFCYKVQNCLG